MSVYIKGMEMPKKAEECRFFGDAMFGRKPYCYVRTGGSCHFPEDCPLVPIPPHGRLIDADALSEKMVICSKHIPKDSFEWDLCGEVITQLALAPTIIEAEGEE